MNLAKFAIPPQYRLLAALGVFVVVAAAAAWGGWTISRWRADAHYAGQIADLNKTISDQGTDITDRNQSIERLERKVKAQNEAVEALGKKSEQIADEQRLARLKAEEAAEASAARLESLRRSIAGGATAQQALQAYWEMSR